MKKAKVPERRCFCAICDKTNQTVRLCDACRADPANEGWNERTMYNDQAFLESPDDEDDRNSGDLDARHRLAEIRDRKPRKVAEHTRQILQLVGLYQVVDYRRPRGKARLSREWIPECRPLNLSEVAFLVGVSRAAVAVTLRRYEPLMRTVLSSVRAEAERDW